MKGPSRGELVSIRISQNEPADSFVGDRVRIAPQFQDPGDDKFERVVPRHRRLHKGSNRDQHPLFAAQPYGTKRGHHVGRL